MSGLKPIFEPSSVAVVGASNNPKKFGNIILRNILDSGFKGRVFAVNPKETEILGQECVNSILHLKEAVDLAVIVIPADLVPRAIGECGQKGVRGAVIISGGFRETGKKGASLERRIIQEGKRYGMRIVGPNCQGVNNPYHPICVSWPLFKLKGEMAIIAQSGTIAIAFTDMACLDKLGISALACLGNKADVDEADLIEYFSEHRGTRVISLYIEGVSRPEKFLRALKGCRKPIVILKSGRTDPGKAAAESHTSSLAGNDQVYDGVLKQHRVYRADTFEEFYDFSKALAYLGRPNGKRLVFITSSGGAAVLAIDIADKIGLDIPPIPNEIKKELRTLVPTGASLNNPIDLTGDGDAEMFKKVAEIVRPYFDTLVYIFGDPIVGVSEIVRMDTSELVIFLGGAEVERRERNLMQKRKIPVFPTPERGIKAFSKLFAQGKILEPVHLKPSYQTKGKEVLVRMVEAFKKKRKKILSEHDAKLFLSTAGIPVTREVLVGSLEEAQKAAADIGYPIVLKGSGPDIIHKTELGLIKLNLRDEADLNKAFSELMNNPRVTLDRLLVQEMVQGDRELIVGLIKDPQFGPCVMFGIGGIYTEIIKDICFRSPPLDHETAHEMIEGIRMREILGNVRGQNAVAKDILLNILLIISTICMEFSDIKEIDINPLKIDKMGELKAVDALVLLQG